MLNLLENNETNKAELRIRNAYKSVFSGALGELVLQDMMQNMFFLQPCKTAEEQALCNYAKSILALVYGADIESHKLLNIIQKVLRRKKNA